MASALDNHQCDHCRKRHVAEEADVWCFECNEFLCSNCNEIYRDQNVTKDHKPIQITDYFKLSPTITAIKYECDQHDVKFDCYCTDHAIPICVNCVREIHQMCTIKPLINIADDIKESFLFIDLKDRASDIQLTLQQIIKDVTSKQLKVGEATDRAVSIIEATRRKINRHLDHLQDEFMKKITANENDQRNQINRILATFQALLCDAEKTKECQAQADQQASNLHTFCGIKTWNQKILRLEKRLSSLQKNLQCFERFEVNVSEKLTNIEKDIKEFASIRLEHTQPAVKLLSKEIQGQTWVAKPVVMTDIMLSNANVFTIPSKYSLGVRGCCIMESGSMIFTDLHNERLITVDKTGQLCKNFKLPFHPYNVVEVDLQTVGVTSTLDRRLVLVDISNGKIIKKVYVGEMCYGLCYKDGKFIVSVEDTMIRVIDLNGIIISSIEVKDDATNCCVDRDNLYYSAEGSRSVYCCDISGGNINYRKVTVLME